MWLLVFFVIALLIWKILSSKRDKDDPGVFPPGPKGLPLLGNAYQMIKNPHLKLSEWAKEHGNLYTISLVGKKAVVASDLKSMRTLFGSMSATGRFKLELIDQVLLGNHGVGNSEGHVWLEQQKFAVKSMKKFGFGDGAKLDSLILASCDNLCNMLQNEIQKSATSETKIENPRRTILKNTGSFLWSMITGDANMQSGEMGDFIINWIDAANRATKTGLAFLPQIKYVAPEKSGYNNYIKITNEVQDHARKYFEEHRRTRVPGAEPRDLIDEYLQNLEECTDASSSFFGEEGQINSFSSVLSLMLAGTETSATSVNWLLFYLVTHPQVQERLQQEIEEIIGKDRNPSLQDKPRMPYMEAVIYETLRYSSIVPFGIIHRALDDMEVDQYRLPKGTILIANIYWGNFNPEIWGDPENFRPERFLEGDTTQPRELRDAVLSFQEGRRKCIGSPLAKDLIFLFAARMLQKFSFSMEPGRSKKEYLTPAMGYLLAAPTIGLVVRPQA